MNQELKKIKKLYGEEMAHLCRRLFPTILEQEGLLLKILTDNFNISKFLYNDIVTQKKEKDFKNYINSFVDFQNGVRFISPKTAQELLNEAGYNLYECKSEEEIQYFKKYYVPSEALCTFKGGRLENYYVFFAVKKNIGDIKRRYFIKPQRQDLYGTSVISMQFEKGKVNTLSIKNRYNHKVDNPDATFSNNLELINKGLTASFERDYNLNILSNSSNFELNDYVLASDGKYYKYNLEIDNIYYCPNNIIIDNFEVKKFDTSRYLIIDYFIIDLKEKNVKTYDEITSSTNDQIKNSDDLKNDRVKDSFGKKFIKIKKIEINNTNNGKKIKFYFNDDAQNIAIIELDKSNNIIGIKDPSLTTIDDNYLYYSKAITNFEALNVVTIGNNFLHDSEKLTTLEIPQLTKVGNNFLYSNNGIIIFEALNLSECGDYFLCNNYDLVTIRTPKLKIVGDSFLLNNIKLTSYEFQKLIKAGNFFLPNNDKIAVFILPNLIMAGSYFLCNSKAEIFKALNLKIVGDFCLYNVKTLIIFETPSLIKYGNNFLYDVSKLSKNEALTLSI